MGYSNVFQTVNLYQNLFSHEGPYFSVISKTLPNNDFVAAIEDAVKDLGD